MDTSVHLHQSTLCHGTHKASKLSPAVVVSFHISGFILGEVHGAESVQFRVAIVGVERFDCNIMMVSNNCHNFFHFLMPLFQSLRGLMLVITMYLV